MRNLIFIVVSVVFLSAISACSTAGKSAVPTIGFKTASGYQSTDFNLQTYAEATIGVAARRTSDRDPLKRFVVYRTFNGAGGEYPYDEVDNLSGDDANIFSKDYTINAGGNQGTFIYTFYIYTESGTNSSCTITVTVI